MSWIGVITNAGTALLAQWTSGGHTLTIDKATVGSGIRSAVNLRTATALAHEEADASIVSAKEVTGGTQFRIRVSPAAVTAYTAHEIGIWGHLDNDQELTLIAIHQDADTGVEVPTAASMPSFQFDLYCLHAIGNEGTLNITLAEEVYPTMDEMNTAIGAVQDEIDGINSTIEDILGNFATWELTTTASKSYHVGECLVLNRKLYEATAEIDQGDTLSIGTNIEQTNVGAKVANRRLWFKDVAVSAITGSIIDLSDSRITADYVLEGGVITWGDSSKITSLTNWSTDTVGHFIVTGTASAATTATFALVKADQRIEANS